MLDKKAGRSTLHVVDMGGPHHLGLQEDLESYLP